LKVSLNDFDSKEEILAISTGLVKLLEIGEDASAGEIVVEGDYFLESIFRKLYIEIGKRKNNSLVPGIRTWPERIC
jgi:hypothetical protein